MKYKFLFFVLLCVFFLPQVQAKQIPPRSNTLVTDYVSLLSDAERQALERKLVAYDDSTSTQIAIVIESSLEGDDIFEYSYRLAEGWGIGREGRDNGILIYIAFQDRDLFIQTGYGAEGFLTDAMASRIIDQIITPAFRSQQYYRGLDEATTVIMQMGSGEYSAAPPERASKGKEALFILFLVIVAVIIFFNIAGGNDDDWDDDGGYHRRGRYDYDDYGRPRRRGRGGGWIFLPGGGGGWSGGGGGGFGGGGFGGFGGGGFGGGGAGGSW